MKISIVVPVYNAERYLPACLDSLLAQTLKDIEIICIDDGSTDGSGAVLDAYRESDARVRVVHKPNAGVAAARNDGLDAATGEGLMFCDADDEYAPNFCERMRDELLRTDVDAVVSGTRFVCEEGYAGTEERIDADYWNPPRTGLVELHPYDRLDKVNCMLWNKLFRMEPIRRYGIRFPDVRGHEDDAFWYQYMMVSSRVLLIPDRLYAYRLRSGSITDLSAVRKTPLNRNDRLEVVRFVLAFARRHGLARRLSPFLLELGCSYYQMVMPFFSAEELSRIRRDILAEMSDLVSPTDWIVEAGDRLAVFRRAPRRSDGLVAVWHLLRTGVAVSRKTRLRRMFKFRLYREAWAEARRRRARR